MKEFLVGLSVLIILLLLSVAGAFLLPFIVVLGVFLKWLISLALLILAIWLVGKVTLMAIEYLKKKP